MTKTKLKHCPFCGCEAWLHTHGHVLSDAQFGHRVECEGECHAMTCYWHTKQQAIDNWNKRTSQKALPVGDYTGRCGKCGSDNLWEDNLVYGCNTCGDIRL